MKSMPTDATQHTEKKQAIHVKQLMTQYQGKQKVEIGMLYFTGLCLFIFYFVACARVCLQCSMSHANAGGQFDMLLSLQQRSVLSLLSRVMSLACRLKFDSPCRRVR
jgi:hypothetical protein